MSRWPILALGLAATLCATADSAPAAEQFLGIDIFGQFVTFTSDGAQVARRGSDSALGGLRTLGLDSLPDGRVLGIDASGRLYDLDPATLSVARRYDGPSIAGSSAIQGASTFTVAPDGATALVASGDGAQRIDLATGAATPVPALRAAAPDGGAAVNPTVDTLPDGRLSGIDWARPAVATEATAGGGLAELGGTAVDWLGPTRFSLDPSGQIGWLVTRAAEHRSVLVAVNPATGASGRPVALSYGIDAFVALGPTPGSTTPDAPSGAPLPVPAAGPASIPPNRFAAKVTVSLPTTSRAEVLRRHGLRARFTTSARVRVIVIAMLGQQKVCAAEVRLAPGASRRLVRCAAAALRRLRRARGNHLVVFFTFRDTRGAAVRTRRVTMRP